MKVTLTIETVNDKPIPDDVNPNNIREYEEKIKQAWQIALNYICMISDENESAKVIEAKLEES